VTRRGMTEFTCHLCGTHKRSSKELPHYWNHLLGEPTARYLCGRCSRRTEDASQRWFSKVAAKLEAQRTPATRTRSETDETA
jgi:hypothetical protein